MSRRSGAQRRAARIKRQCSEAMGRGLVKCAIRNSEAIGNVHPIRVMRAEEGIGGVNYRDLATGAPDSKVGSRLRAIMGGRPPKGTPERKAFDSDFRQNIAFIRKNLRIEYPVLPRTEIPPAKREVFPKGNGRIRLDESERVRWIEYTDSVARARIAAGML